MCNVFLIPMYIKIIPFANDIIYLFTGIVDVYFFFLSSCVSVVCAIRCTCGARLILNVSFESYNTPKFCDGEASKRARDVTAHEKYTSIYDVREFFFYFSVSSTMKTRCVCVCMYVQHMPESIQMPKERHYHTWASIMRLYCISMPHRWWLLDYCA